MKCKTKLFKELYYAFTEDGKKNFQKIYKELIFYKILKNI